jgi:heat shock protein HtpX
MEQREQMEQTNKTPRRKPPAGTQLSAAKTVVISLRSKFNALGGWLNQVKLWLALVILSLCFMVSGYQLYDRNGLVVGFFVALGMNALVFFYDEWRLLGLFPSTEIEGHDPWGLVALNRSLARQNGLPMPRLHEVHSETPFIFSAGLVPARLKIFISSSLVIRLNPDELKALFTHELLRSQTGLTQLATAAVSIADMWLIVAGLVDALLTLRFIWHRRSKRTRVIFGPLTAMSFPFVAIFLRVIIRRKSYLSVDRMAVSQTGQEKSLLNALVKLDAYGKNLPLDVNLAEAALFSVNPLSFYKWSRWIAVQPTLESRARSLTGHFPI